MSLPPPNFAFTVPSIHDDTILSCRLYIPRKHLLVGSGHVPKAAIVAHPYAPLGGCYDDPIVDSVGGVLLKAGYAICTFNFRGAAGSPGRTSWSAKPELGDYVSLYGFMIYYLNGLLERTSSPSDKVEGQLSAVPSAGDGAGSFVQIKPVLRLILAGYSYGSMIACHLPSVSRVFEVFQNAAEGSAESEVQLRAVHLASQTWKGMESRQERSHRSVSLKVPASHRELGSSKSSSSVFVGGFESEAVEHRIEQESRRSLDVRKSLDRVREKIQTRPHQHRNSSEGLDPAGPEDSQNDLVVPQVCYLLVSPVLPPLATVATFFSTLSFHARRKEDMISGMDVSHEVAHCPSLAVYGNKDRFTPVKKLRIWARALNQMPGSNFGYHEVDGAGHFWHDTSALEQMKKHITDWTASLGGVQG